MLQKQAGSIPEIVLRYSADRGSMNKLRHDVTLQRADIPVHCLRLPELARVGTSGF